MLVAANRDTVFTRLVELVEHPEWLHDDRFSIHGARGEHMAELDQLVSAWTCVQDSADLLDRPHEAGVPAGLIYTAEDMLSDPHVQARQAIVRLMHAKLGAFPMQNLAPRLSRTPGSVQSLGPELGEHNDDLRPGARAGPGRPSATPRARGDLTIAPHTPTHHPRPRSRAMAAQEKALSVRTITSAFAQELVANAEKVATTNGKPMVITVVDREGNLKAFSRMDGTPLLSVETSQNRAYTAAAFGLSTDT